MLKFQRNYYAEFEIIEDDKEPQYLTIKYPTTLQLQIDLGAYNSANAGTFQFYNLSPQDQALLWRDVYNIGSKQIKMTLHAGYGDIMPVVFYSAFIQECTSYKNSGGVDWITELHAFEGGKLYQYGYINDTITKSTDAEDVINYMVSKDESVKVGCISPELDKLPRNRTFIGQVMDVLANEYAGYEVFIDKGKLHILSDNDVIEGEVLTITDASGLLASPKRANIYVEIYMLFEPQLRIGQAVSLQSSTSPQFNQLYKVIAIKHSGIISDAVCGKLITKVTLQLLQGKPRIVKETKPKTYEGETTSKWTKPVIGGKITSSFGKRTSPTKGASTNHAGIDIGVAQGTPVYAPANGKVTMARINGGYGNCVQIDNGLIDSKQVSSLYGHLQSWAVQTGETVYKGQSILGYVGSTGISTGPHLHFEIRENGQPVNPLKYIGSI